MLLALRNLRQTALREPPSRFFTRSLGTAPSTKHQPWSAIVTGGAAGIGEAVSRKLASRGINIVVADLQVDRGIRLASQLASEYGVEAEYIRVDVTKEEDIKNMVTLAVKRWGRLDYAANCAGVCFEKEWDAEETVTTAIVEKTWAINQRGIWLSQKHEALQMKLQEPRAIEFRPSSKLPVKAQRGAIANISSISGINAMGLAAYTPTKYAVVGITKNGAKFYGPHGIRCNAICPGLTMTAMLEVTMGNAGKEGSAESQESAILNEVGLRRMAFAQEQANVMSFLLSHESTYVNGEYIVVDGGYNCIR